MPSPDFSARPLGALRLSRGWLACLIPFVTVSSLQAAGLRMWDVGVGEK